MQLRDSGEGHDGSEPRHTVFLWAISTWCLGLGVFKSSALCCKYLVLKEASRTAPSTSRLSEGAEVLGQYSQYSTQYSAVDVRGTSGAGGAPSRTFSRLSSHFHPASSVMVIRYSLLCHVLRRPQYPTQAMEPARSGLKLVKQ